jgi:hypothetical protein
MSLAALAKWLEWKLSPSKGLFEDSPSSQSTIRGSGALFWGRVLDRAESQRRTNSNVGYQPRSESGLGSRGCLASRRQLLPHQWLGKGAS